MRFVFPAAVTLQDRAITPQGGDSGQTSPQNVDIITESEDLGCVRVAFSPRFDRAGVHAPADRGRPFGKGLHLAATG
eukprot:15449838-Alexandrium_andersonii.AAC.1